MVKDYYGLLGVSQGASDSELKRAYRKLAREYHPDVNPDPHAQERFKEITQAYEVLTDPERRRIVDAGGDPMQPGGGMGAGMGGFGGGLGDVFEAFFGGGMSRPKGPKSRVQPGEDSHTQISVTLEECARGIEKEITVDTAVLCPDCKGSGSETNAKPVTCPVCGGTGEVQQVQRSILGQIVTTRPCPECKGVGSLIEDPCHTCEGEGRIRSQRKITFSVPAGVASGMQMRLSGQGEVGRGGGGAGDLYITIVEKKHPVFTREGDTLHAVAHVPMIDAALGSTFSLKSVLDEDITVEIPQGTQPGNIITVKNQGMPKLRQSGTNSRGNLLVHVEIIVPQKLDHDQRSLLESFRKKSTEEVLVAGTNKSHQGIFSRFKNTFTGR